MIQIEFISGKTISFSYLLLRKTRIWMLICTRIYRKTVCFQWVTARGDRKAVISFHNHSIYLPLNPRFRRSLHETEKWKAVFMKPCSSVIQYRWHSGNESS